MWEQLVQLGIEPKDARFYLAVLERGKPTVAEAAEHAGVSRTNAYDIAKRLAHRGLLSFAETRSSGRHVLLATDPQRLVDEWREHGRMLDAVVPQLQAIHDKAGVRPRVRYFEGADGIRSVLFETLNWPSPLRGILSMVDLLNVPGEAAMNEYIEGRRQRGLWLHVIRSREKESDFGWPTDPSRFRVARYAPAGRVFTMTTIVSGGSVALISSRQESFGLIIDSEEFAALHGNMFDVLWEASTPSDAPVDGS
ncbi:MAG: transcriptional regulator [Streptosporangiales bacterium]|nr:transcriptional regulator [Streptosporangiales bacterium]